MNLEMRMRLKPSAYSSLASSRPMPLEALQKDGNKTEGKEGYGDRQDRVGQESNEVME